MGVAGAGRAVGTTHLAIWTANYLAGVNRERVAVLEWNHHGDFAAMGRIAGVSNKADATGQQVGSLMFRILEVDYYQQADASVFAHCLNGQYRRVIVDYGSMEESGLYECARCDRKVIVGAFSEWQSETFLEAVAINGKRDKSWHFAAAFGSEESRIEWEKRFSIECLRIPFSGDAFMVTRADMDFFKKMTT